MEGWGGGGGGGMWGGGEAGTTLFFFPSFTLFLLGRRDKNYCSGKIDFPGHISRGT